MNSSNSYYFFKDHPISPPFTDPPIIITDRLKTPGNLGSIIRLAGNIGDVKVLAIHEGEPHRLSSIKKLGETTGKVIDWQYCTCDEAFDLIPSGYVITALETSPDSVNIFNCTLPKKICLIVGNESHGISEEVLKRAALKVHIPITGRTKSLNVSHAASVGLFEWLRQQFASLG